MNQENQAPLTPEEIERYARHIVMREVGGTGQQKLKSARVLVVGAGGLGSPVLQYLAAAGVGTLGIVDDDHVSRSNLQRQVIHDTDQINQRKVDSAQIALKRINPNTNVEKWPVRLSRSNGLALISQYDIVADGSDNFDTRYLCADFCEELKVPLVSAAVAQFEGSITTLAPHLVDENGKAMPRLRDIFPQQPPDGLIPNCEEAGILGCLTGIMGAMQAQEVIKLILGLGDTLVGKLAMFDSRFMTMDTIAYQRESDQKDE